MIIERIDQQLADEQYEAGKANIATALAAADRTTRWRLRLRQAELSFGSEDEGVDEALLVLDDLLAPTDAEEHERARARSGAYEPELARAHAARIRGFGYKRCPNLAKAAAEAAAERGLADHPRLLVARGRAALLADERAEAGALFRQALEVAPDDEGARFELANLLYVLADFQACHGELDRLPGGGRYDRRAKRLRAACHGAVQDYTQETEVWRSLIREGAEGDFMAGDRIGLALTLASAGERSEALEVMREVWRDDPESARGQYARRRIEHLEAAGPDTARKQLKAFPTTYQKWDYCGPAVLELCLRYLGLELGQDEIATAVKREGGTPMFEIVAYLEGLGIEARRVEATGPRLCAAIDLGLPVILQEEYSTASHVAVITGYDEGLGLFISQDPSGHRPRLKSFEWTADAGQLYGNGGVVVLGRANEDLDELRAKADAAGLVSARHLQLLDACDREGPEVLGEGRSGVAQDEILRLCDEAIQLCPDFKLAYYRRFGALAAKGDEDVLKELFRIRSRFQGESWTHDLHARWLFYEEERCDEAYVQFRESFRRDPMDARASEFMGECKWLVGDLERAETDLLKSLALEPFRPRPAENLAAIYLRQLIHLDESNGAREEPNEGRSMAPTELRTLTKRTSTELLERALHFNTVGLAYNEENPFNHVVRGELLARDDDLDGAVAAYQRALELEPQRYPCFWGLADLLEQQGDHAAAEANYQRCAAEVPPLVPTYRLWAQFLARRERHTEALEVLRQGIALLEEGGRERLLPALVKVLETTHPGAAGAAELRALAESYAGDGVLLREAARLLRDHNWRDDAAALLRRILQDAPNDVASLDRLARLLLVGRETRDEGRALMERVRELAPYAVGPRCELAWLLLKEDAAAGLALLEPILEIEDSGVWDTQSALLAALGRDDDSVKALVLALEAEGTPTLGLVRLCEWHLSNHRYDRVYELVGFCEDLELDELSLWAVSQWEEELEDQQAAMDLFEEGSHEDELLRRAFAHAVVGELWDVLRKPQWSREALTVALESLERLPEGPIVQRAIADTLSKRASALGDLDERRAGVEDFARAAAIYTALVLNDPERAEDLIEVLREQGELLWRDGEKARARAALDLACAVSDPEGADEQLLDGLRESRADALLVRARLRAEDEIKSAIADARAALALHEARAPANQEPAEDQAIGDEVDDSEERLSEEEVFEARAAHLSEVGEAVVVLADLLEQDLQLVEARAALESLRDRIEPFLAGGAGHVLAELSSRVTQELVGVFLHQGDAQLARQSCQREIDALEADEQEADPYVLGTAYQSLGVVCLDLLSDPRGAIAAFSRALELNVNNLGALGNRGYAALRLLHPERALTDADSALNYSERYLDPDGPRRPLEEALAMRSIGCAYELLDEVDNALAAGERSRELFEPRSDDTNIRGFLAESCALVARLLLRQGELPRAQALSARAVNLLSELNERGSGVIEMDLVKALRTQAAVQRAAGEHATALATLTRAETFTRRWIELGGGFQDVLADVERLRALVLQDQGDGAGRDVAFERSVSGLSEAIAAGATYMLPALLGVVREWVKLCAPREGLLEGLATTASAACAEAEEWTRTSLVARRRAALMEALAAGGYALDPDLERRLEAVV